MDLLSFRQGVVDLVLSRLIDNCIIGLGISAFRSTDSASNKLRHNVNVTFKTSSFWDGKKVHYGDSKTSFDLIYPTNFNALPVEYGADSII